MHRPETRVRPIAVLRGREFMRKQLRPQGRFAHQQTQSPQAVESAVGCIPEPELWVLSSRADIRGPTQDTDLSCTWDQADPCFMSYRVEKEMYPAESLWDLNEIIDQRICCCVATDAELSVVKKKSFLPQFPGYGG